MTTITRVAVIGGGIIGSGWAARFILNGINVKLYDPSMAAVNHCHTVLANAERAYRKLFPSRLPPAGRLEFADSLADAVENVRLIQENTPENPQLKQSVLAEIDRHAPHDALICSSTSGLLPSRLQTHLRHPQRFMVGHPFNPVYLLPLVEICGGSKTTPEKIQQAIAFYRTIGMKPLRVKKEIDGFIADRLLEALWRESLWLVHDNIANVSEVDDAIRYGAGLRWALMGSFQTYRIAGGMAGMRHFMEQFGPALKWPWSKLTDTPELTDAFLDKIVEQSDEQAQGLSITDMERQRDDGLITILQGLQRQHYGAGQVLNDHQRRLYSSNTSDNPAPQSLRLLTTSVKPEWVDYNNHMTESRYLEVFGHTTDALLALIGVDAAYLKSGYSYYTVETHMMHLREVAVSEPLYTTTQVLAVDKKRIHVFHRLHHGKTDDILASAEHMLLHVDTHAGKACPAQPAVQNRLQSLLKEHQSLAYPPHAGRRVGMG